VDRKPERAIQAKVRDSKKNNKEKDMTTKVCQRKDILFRFTNGDFHLEF